MNKSRRGRLRLVRTKLEDAKNEIESILEEEDEARDNTAENLVYSERYERSEECSESMENAIESLSDAIEHVENAL